MFFIRWAYSPEEGNRLFELVVLSALRTGAASLAKTFEAVYDDIAMWFRERVVEYVISFQTSIDGNQWQQKWNHQRYAFFILLA